ncbi:SGNH/GDSL hydrolase family protein [Pedobacter alluvionis]|uniref:G-D-S-L family lipolytic protein n=1 Tax=Pedobacter alluvionis TaxID=475253 RepID=A0A497Y8S4_9SPHI|nr:SGNH/GDSL hydrolase family protein [Pedobacter alluvionis]RLJ79903.1 GDSL-like lipase/acylhydrolase family protein [Pedobacter alluvionis]TFB31210.1 G-D-S-L family lipolytic protein [Pedobacter alluvionis]
MKKYILNSFVAAAILFTAACKPEIETPAGTTAGQANFSKYIAVGNSLTSGFADGGLYLEGQKVAYPNLIAAKMASVGGGAFTSPFFSEEHSNGSGYISLTALVNGTPTLTPIIDKLAFRDPAKHLDKYSGEIQNLGIPGMRVDLSFDPTLTFSAANPYFERLLTDAQVGKTNYFQYIQGRNHTFFSLWLGNNDVLGYALNGAVTVTGDPTTVLTDKVTFSSLYANFLNALTAGGQKGIVATIPDVTAVPYFNTVTVAALLNAAKAINPAAAAIYIQTGTGAVRPATADDLIRLPFQSAGLFGQGAIPYGLHPLNPIENKWVLDKDEVVKVKDYVNSYNSSIKSLATSKGLAIADTYAYFNQVKTGINVQGVGINASFITGGAFSLDGIHLTPRGNAAIANLFIDAINAKYGSTVPNIDITQYRGVKFPDAK